jgi:hypothetical protein
MNKTEIYLTQMYDSVDRMNQYELNGDFVKAEEEKYRQTIIKRKFFGDRKNEK